MGAHDGLRGVSALWVVLFHCILQCPIPVNFQGSSIMPLFFMLSGYSMAVTYGKTTWRVTSAVHSEELVRLRPFDSKRFYRNRFARVMPVYYLCNLLAAPLVYIGFNQHLSPGNTREIVSNVIVNVIPIATLLDLLFGSNFDGPAWTICTLVIMWLFVPRHLPRAQRKTDHELVRSIINMYWLQLFTAIFIFFGLVAFVGFWPAFALATFHPITRLPLFYMGMYAGLLCLRYPGGDLPWPTSCFKFFPVNANNKSKRSVDTTKDREHSNSTEEHGLRATQFWSRASVLHSWQLLILTLTVSLVDAYVKFKLGGDSIFGEVWLQAIVPYAQLSLIVALSRDGGASLAARVLCRPFAQWLGKISMSLYLVHYPLIFYTCCIIHGGPMRRPSEFHCNKLPDIDTQHTCEVEVKAWQDAFVLPIWGIPLVTCASLLLGGLIHYTVEEPARRVLRAPVPVAVLQLQVEVGDKVDTPIAQESPTRPLMQKEREGP